MYRFGAKYIFYFIIHSFFFQFVSIYQTHSQETWLPKYVFRVNNCPDPYNSSEWTRASKRLNCLHSLNSEKIDNVYHCIASAFLNETVEFCGRSILVTAGTFFSVCLSVYPSVCLSLSLVYPNCY